MNKYLFLDLDGVTNCHVHNPISNCNTHDKDKIDLINKILEETGAKIVLTSSQRYLIFKASMSLEGFNNYMRTHGLKEGAIVGCIGPDPAVPIDTVFDGKPWSWPVEVNRGKKITEWLAMHKDEVENYLVIDDLDLGIKDEEHPFMKVDGTKGIQEWQADTAIDWLKPTKARELGASSTEHKPIFKLISRWDSNNTRTFSYIADKWGVDYWASVYYQYWHVFIDGVEWRSKRYEVMAPTPTNSLAFDEPKVKSIWIVVEHEHNGYGTYCKLDISGVFETEREARDLEIELANKYIFCQVFEKQIGGKSN